MAGRIFTMSKGGAATKPVQRVAQRRNINQPLRMLNGFGFHCASVAFAFRA